MNHGPALKAAVDAVKTLLSKPGLSATDIQTVYDSHFCKAAFATTAVKSRPQFSEEVYPSLPVRFLGITDPNLIPKWKSAKELLALAAKDDSVLTKILAAYIWKRGELGRVRYVPEGVLAAMTPTKTALVAQRDEVEKAVEDVDGPVVMWQFGRHVSGVDEHPIFDQHTHRAFRILKFEVRSPKGELRIKHLKEYLTWWGEEATRNFPPLDSQGRAAATYALDKLLFSVGKAALLSPQSYSRPLKKTKQKVSK